MGKRPQAAPASETMSFTPDLSCGECVFVEAMTTVDSCGLYGYGFGGYPESVPFIKEEKLVLECASSMTRGATRASSDFSIVGTEPHHTTGRKQYKKENQYTKELERS
ncbi:hypothetical protein QVD17_41739 [Tagetes erecta]|uniref:Uncharacterized protein n=1 Tax=Tagetes erecta TaxID=13708 RepID=A0AAD8NFT9_TARER|nr:hypothetical protein QVD17_41739 [Tagetes erecta]